jgi:hypothetical protein
MVYYQSILVSFVEGKGFVGHNEKIIANEKMF